MAQIITGRALDIASRLYSGDNWAQVCTTLGWKLDGSEGARAQVERMRAGDDAPVATATLNASPTRVVATAASLQTTRYSFTIGGAGMEVKPVAPAPRPRITPGDAPRADEFVEVVADKAIVFGDAHVPMHDHELLEEMCETALEYGVKTAICNGDFFDMGQFRRPDEFSYQSEQGQAQMSLGEQVVLDLLAVFDEIVFTDGNHDKWLYRHLGGHFDSDVLFSRMVRADYHLLRLKHETGVEKRLRWAGKEAAVLASGGKRLWVAHGRSYSASNPLGPAKKIADRRGMGVILGHQHHSTIGFHPDGVRQLVAVGCSADPGKFAYCNTGSDGNPAMTQSYALVLGGVAHLLHKGDAARLRRRAG